LCQLDLQRESAVSELTDLAATWKAGSLALLETTKATFSAKSEFTQEEVGKCESVAESTMRTLVQFTSALRAAGLDSEADGKYHPLSPESKDAWAGVSALARAMRSVDGDADDVNYLLRARALENQLMEAVENGPKLSLANTKVSTLEKVRMISLLILVDASVFDPHGQTSRIDFSFPAESCISIEGNRNAKCAPIRARESSCKNKIAAIIDHYQVCRIVVF
jgi:hypothetical protein